MAGGGRPLAAGRFAVLTAVNPAARLVDSSNISNALSRSPEILVERDPGAASTAVWAVWAPLAADVDLGSYDPHLWIETHAVGLANAELLDVVVGDIDIMVFPLTIGNANSAAVRHPEPGTAWRAWHALIGGRSPARSRLSAPTWRRGLYRPRHVVLFGRVIAPEADWAVILVPPRLVRIDPTAPPDRSFAGYRVSPPYEPAETMYPLTQDAAGVAPVPCRAVTVVNRTRAGYTAAPLWVRVVAATGGARAGLAGIVLAPGEQVRLPVDRTDCVYVGRTTAGSPIDYVIEW